MTAVFWQVLDRLGAEGAAACDWRHYLGDEWDRCRPLLVPAHRIADMVIDPARPPRRLLVDPDGECGFVGLVDDIEADHAPLALTPEDVTVWVPDWDFLTDHLSAAMDFAGNRWERHGCTRQIGTAQHGANAARPVILCLPPGHAAGRAQVFRELASRRDATVLMPTLRLVSPQVHALAAATGLTLVGLDRFCEAETVREQPSPYLAAPREATATKGALRPVLKMQNGWTWDMLTIEVAAGGRLFFCCGGQRKQVRLRKSRGRNHSEGYEIMLRLAGLHATGKEVAWRSPSVFDADAETVRKRFRRVERQISELFPAPGQPFRRNRDRTYTPKFRIILHAELAARAQTLACPGGDS